MSKDNTNLRLLGSPVNLSYRSKKKNDNYIRNRPRSALQNSSFSITDKQDQYKRPYSADTKGREPTTHTFKGFSSELLQPFDSTDYTIPAVKVLPPTADLLQHSGSGEYHSLHRYHLDKDNVSDYGSEDTFVSLGSKIKAKAQHNKSKSSLEKNLVKTRSTFRKSRKAMESVNNKEGAEKNEFRMEVNITEKSRSPSPGPSRDGPSMARSPYESFFVPLEPKRKVNDSFTSLPKPRDEKSLAGRVSFGSSSIQSEIEDAIDTYSRRLTLTKQQLSLVEEESHEDSPSLSHNVPSLSPEPEYNQENITNQNTYVSNANEQLPKTQNFINETKTYNSFYNDFNTNQVNFFKSKLSSTVVHTDTSSKDSGYTEFGLEADKSIPISYQRDYSLPTTSAIRKSNSFNKIEEQPKSLDSSSSEKNHLKTFPLDKKSQFADPMNHSRLLYKDFFLKKEEHVAQPQNSPDTSMSHAEKIPKIDEDQTKVEEDNENVDYPPYLLNSTTKAYTSKIIEDYKKELEAINNLHELTLKDIKTDTVSPTPLNIDRLFEQNSATFDAPESIQSVKEKDKKSTGTVPTSDNKKDKNILENTKSDISKVSTKELIQNYFKVKSRDDPKDFFPRSLQKYDKKVSRAISKMEVYQGQKQDWNNKMLKSHTVPNILSSKAVNIKNQTQKNVFTVKTPTSARLESVQNDKDIDSWMSLSKPSPRVIVIDYDKTAGDQQPKENGDTPTVKKTTAQTTDDENNASGHQQVENSDTNPSGTKAANHKLDYEKNTASTTKNKVDDSENRVPHSNTSPDKDLLSSKPPESSKKDLNPNSTVLDIYTMLKEIESFGDNPVTSVTSLSNTGTDNLQDGDSKKDEAVSAPKDSYSEIFEFLEKVEQSANDALSVVTTTTPSTMPKLENLLKLPATELAQRLVTASLQLDERSCCIALLQESLATHKEQMIQKVSSLEKQSQQNIRRVKQECEEAIKRHQTFIDQLINDKKTLNHRIEQLVDERRAIEERWKRAAQALEERYRLELRTQHDKMAAAQQVARQRWVRQKAEKIKELTVKGLEGELREMAERQQKEVADLRMCHAEALGRLQATHSAELDALRRTLLEEKEAALVKERQMASQRLEKQILELESTYQQQRTRLVAEMRAENERVAASLGEREMAQRQHIEKWKEEQEQLIEEKRCQLEMEIAKEKEKIEEQMHQKQKELEQKFEEYKKEFEAQQQVLLKKKVTEIAAQHKQERDREIEKAIESMEAEAQAGRRELQEAIRRNKEQYEMELQELGQTEQATLRRYQEAQARVRATEDKCAELEVQVNQLETRNKVITEKNIELEHQLEEIRARCNAAWSDKVDSLRKEMEDMKTTHEEQMHQLYAKVKVAVARKDSAIGALTRETAKYQEKIAVLEQKLSQQRKDFLKHK